LVKNLAVGRSYLKPEGNLEKLPLSADVIAAPLEFFRHNRLKMAKALAAAVLAALLTLWKAIPQTVKKCPNTLVGLA
jgi:hypothetical protein